MADGSGRGGAFAVEASECVFLGTIVAGNRAGNTAYNNAFYQNSYLYFALFCIDSENSCGFNGLWCQVNTDPGLGPLRDNGGPTATHAITVDSPAFDRNFPEDYVTAGVARPQG